ncbi:hypothetical protein ACJW30_03G165900 [Castanea mollissima]
MKWACNVWIPFSLLWCVASIISVSALSQEEPQLGSVRVVFQTNYGDIEFGFGFLPTVAPKTVDHIFKLVRLGCYNTNNFFGVYCICRLIRGLLPKWLMLWVEEQPH